MFEPHSLAIKRSPSKTVLQQDNGKQDDLDYSKLPRSSGDGMEFSSEGETLPQQLGRKEVPEIKSTVAPSRILDQKQSLKKNITHTPLESKFLESNHTKLGSGNVIQSSNSKGLKSANQIPADQSQDSSETFPTTSPYPNSEHRIFIDESEQKIPVKKDTCNDSPRISQFPLAKSSSHPSVNNSASFKTPLIEKTEQMPNNGNEISSTVNTARNNLVKERTLEKIPECIDSRLIISEFEERDAKLVEEKVKLSVQLGVQSKVNSELKTLLVASVGEELENKLENYVQTLAQHEVELKHWTNMCEEYQEESERLEIECDVWRTKFLASRMMSDELSSWRSTTYAHYRQSQSALQRLLSERVELQQHLTHTNKQLQLLSDTLKHISGCYDNSIMGNKVQGVSNQSVLEVASINSCLTQALVDLTLKIFPSVPLLRSDHSLMDKQNNYPSDQYRKVMENTPAEKMALQVLSREIDLTTEEKQGDVMRRMGRQYIGHGHKSRLLTNTFRVTFDCCDRCKGKLQVV